MKRGPDPSLDSAAEALPPALDALPETGDVEEALQAFSRLSESLLVGYDALRSRAEAMEAELVRTNAKLASKVAELEAILEALPSGVLVRDGRGRVTRANDAAMTLLGRGSEDLLGVEELPEVQSGTVLEDSPTELLIELRRVDGLRLVVARRTSPVMTPSQGRIGSIEVLDDRTVLTEMSERLHQLDKMAALGTMAGGIAHEIRNPMNAIKGFAHLIRRQLDSETTVGRFAERICQGVAEADAIIASMLTLAAPEQLQQEVIDVPELVDEVRLLCSRELPPTVTLEVASASGSLIGDRIKLRQALRNLVQNGVEVQPQGGLVRLDAEVGRKEAVFHVHDAGPGISPELRRRVREPFFTTRAKGTGLGLSLVHTIAELHQGTFEVSTSPSPLGGAHVLLRVPVTSVRTSPGNGPELR